MRFEPGALPLLVRAAEGSLRDALSLLDTAIAYGGGALDEASVARILGSSSPVHVRGARSKRRGRSAWSFTERSVLTWRTMRTPRRQGW